MHDPRPTLRDRNRARARAEIVVAAHQLFLKQGYAETSVEQIAEAAGMAPRTVFRPSSHQTAHRSTHS